MMVSMWWLLVALSIGFGAGMIAFGLLGMNSDRSQVNRKGAMRPRELPPDDAFGGPSTVTG